MYGVLEIFPHPIFLFPLPNFTSCPSFFSPQTTTVRKLLLSSWNNKVHLSRPTRRLPCESQSPVFFCAFSLALARFLWLAVVIRFGCYDAIGVTKGALNSS